MRQVRCDGCGMTESDEVMKNRKIEPVTLTIIEDPRFPQGIQEYKADLCDTCRGAVLHNYFNKLAGGTLEVPAFVALKSA